MQQPRSASPRNRWLHVVAALLVAAVFLSLPPLSYLHDRLSTVDNTAHFRPGKNLERPHERQAAAVIVACRAPTGEPDLRACGRTASDGTLAHQSILDAFAVPRAPPAC
jgi:hypothetical protein